MERQPAPGALSLRSDKAPTLPRVSWGRVMKLRVVVKNTALESRCWAQALAARLVGGPRRGPFPSPSFSLLPWKAVVTSLPGWLRGLRARSCTARRPAVPSTQDLIDQQPGQLQTRKGARLRQ